MPVRCQECNSHFLLDGRTVTQGISCPDCGGTKLERDQPSPTHSDGELRDMVDPATQLDQGGNPLQEGIWANVDGGWQPEYRRDETFAKVASLALEPSGIEPQHHGIAQPAPPAGIHNGNLFWLKFLDASINGKPARSHDNEIFREHGFDSHPSWLKPVTVSVHDPSHLEAAIEAVQSPQLSSSPATLIHAPTLKETGRQIMAGELPAPPGVPVQPQQPPVMSNHYTRLLPQEPYLPWYHQADVTRYPAGRDSDPVTLTTEEWANDKRQRYQDRLNQQSGHRLAWAPGTAGRGIMIGGQLHTWPVEKTMENPQGGFMHGEYIRHLGVNPANVDVKTGFEINPDGTTVGNTPPEAYQIDPNLQQGQGEWGQMFGSTKEGFAFLAPLAAAGGRMLLGAALGGLMRKAVGGLGNNTPTAPEPESPYGGSQPLSLVASEHTAVGVGMPVETPGSTPRIVEDHDPEAVDQQEFNDGDHSPAGNNPELPGEAGGSQNPAGGEDQTVQKLEFRHDGDAVNNAEMLLPLILQYVNSDKSALENPQLKALHDQLESEIPDYLNLADENDESVHKLLEALKGGHESKTAAPVYQTTPMNPNQMAMGPQQGQMPMPGTFQNPVQPGGMPVSGKCMNCGGTLNADGSCPQCGASAGANQQGNLEQPGQQHLQTPGIMPSPYARGAHTAADHQGPITPQQKEVFAEYLIQQGRNDEVAAMMANPAMYADEWAQFINKSTQPPEVDPNEQAPPQPQMDPSQMGQMPMPGMSMPQPTGKTAAPTQMGDTKNPRRCPECTSATTSITSEDGDMRCHRCGNTWKPDVLKMGHIKRAWTITAFPDALNDAPNPVAAPAADATAPGDREQQQDSTLTWQSSDGTPLQVGAIYEMHNPGYAIPDIVKVQQVKPDSIVVTMEGEYNSPSDPQDQNGPEYPHEISLQEAQTQGLTFNPVQDGEGDQEQSQDNGAKDGIGQTVNTEPVEQPHDSFPVHTKVVEGVAGFGMMDQDPQGQLQVGQQVSYTAYGGRTEQGTIMGFQPNYARDPFIQNRFGDVKVVSRSDIQSDQAPVQATPSPDPQMAMASVEAGFQRFAPLSEYDQYFGGQPGAAAKAKAAMIKEYGEKKGEEVFYATVNKKKGSVELPTDHCPKCDYGHVTSAYLSPEAVEYECFRCANRWVIAEDNSGVEQDGDSRAWLNEDGDSDFDFDRVAEFAKHTGGQGRNIHDIAKKDPRLADIRERLNKNAGAKFSPREQKAFIDEDGMARNADRLNLEGTHYVESGFDNTKARPDRVNDNYLGLGL
jgi:hypothetical protein